MVFGLIGDALESVSDIAQGAVGVAVLPLSAIADLLDTEDIENFRRTDETYEQAKARFAEAVQRLL